MSHIIMQDPDYDYDETGCTYQRYNIIDDDNYGYRGEDIIEIDDDVGFGNHRRPKQGGEGIERQRRKMEHALTLETQKLHKWEAELRNESAEISAMRRGLEQSQQSNARMQAEQQMVRAQLQAEKKKLNDTINQVAQQKQHLVVHHQHIANLLQDKKDEEAKLKKVRDELEQSRKQLQRVSKKAKEAKQQEQKDNECPVCCETYDVADKDGDKEVVTTLCGHSLHRKCLGNWLVKQNSCPLCRAEIL